MKKFFNEIGFRQEKYIVYCDRQNAIHLIKNAKFYLKSKHTNVRYHCVKDMFENKILEQTKFIVTEILQI